MMNEQFAQWLTGFLEGDGTVACYMRPNNYIKKGSTEPKLHKLLKVDFTQKDPSVLDYIKETLGFGNITYGTTDGTV